MFTRFVRAKPTAASNVLIVPSGALRKNHRWGILHLVESSRDVGAAGRRESVAEARRRYGFGEVRPLAQQEILD